MEVDGLVSPVETVIDNTLRPHTTARFLMNTTKTGEAHFLTVGFSHYQFSLLKLGLSSDERDVHMQLLDKSSHTCKAMDLCP